MQEGIWLTQKPVFDKECVFVTRQKWGVVDEYDLWQVEKVNGEGGRAESVTPLDESNSGGICGFYLRFFFR